MGIPRGKIEIDESQEKCLLRGIKEELNIRIKKSLSKVEHHYNDFLIVLHPFVRSVLDDEIDALEHAQSLPVNRAQLNDFDWTEAGPPIIKEYLAQWLNRKY